MGTRIVVEERGFQKKDRYRQGLGTNTNLCFNTLQEPVRSLLSHRSQLKLTHSKQNSTNDRLSSDERDTFLRSCWVNGRRWLSDIQASW